MEKPDPVLLDDVKRNLRSFMVQRGGTSYIKEGLSKKELGREELCIYSFQPGFEWLHAYSVQVHNIAHLVIRAMWIQSVQDGTLQIYVALDPALEASRREANGTQRKRMKPED